MRIFQSPVTFLSRVTDAWPSQSYHRIIQYPKTLIDRARREAVLRMKESCPEADLVINLRLETSSITKGRGKQIGSVEVLAYGTAIYFCK